MKIERDMGQSMTICDRCGAEIKEWFPDITLNEYGSMTVCKPCMKTLTATSSAGGVYYDTLGVLEQQTYRQWMEENE